jgi:hypothetical protein
MGVYNAAGLRHAIQSSSLLIFFIQIRKQSPKFQYINLFFTESSNLTWSGT